MTFPTQAHYKKHWARKKAWPESLYLFHAFNPNVIKDSTPFNCNTTVISAGMAKTLYIVHVHVAT